LIEVIVCGAAGRMGSRIISKIKEIDNLKLVGAVGRSKHLGKKIDDHNTIISDLNEVIDKNAVVVDFTTPEASMKNMEIAKDRGVSYILGTTGFTEEESMKIKDISNEIPLLYTHNFALGMNIFWELISKAAGLLKDFDVEIINFNGRDKKDAPSGTAHTTASKIAEAKKLDLHDNVIYGRKKGITDEERDKDTIAIHSLRGGSYKSDHKVIFAGDGELIELTHREESISVIVEGVIKSIYYIDGKDAGFYGMEDIIKESSM